MIKFRKSSISNLQSSIPCLFVLVVFLIFIATTESSAAQTWHTVKWVNDGDTIILANGKRVRYIGINAPEIDHEDQKAQPYGYQARSFNKEQVMSKRIRLEYDVERYDRYGRLLAYIFLQDGSFINARLLQAGLAFCLFRNPNVRYNTILLKAQQDAMNLKNGMWRNWNEKENKYIGNRGSWRFHISACPLANKIKSTNKITFFSKWDAFKQGYAPSKECIEEYWSYGAGK